MQNFLEALEFQPGLVAKELALVGRNHVQANHDLNKQLRDGAHAKLAQMKYMACGDDKNRAAFFQNCGFASGHISKPSLLRPFLAAAHEHVDHFASIGTT